MMRESSIENVLSLGLRHLSLPEYFLCNLGGITLFSYFLVRQSFTQQQEKNIFDCQLCVIYYVKFLFGKTELN